MKYAAIQGVKGLKTIAVRQFLGFIKLNSLALFESWNFNNYQ